MHQAPRPSNPESAINRRVQVVNLGGGGFEHDDPGGGVVAADGA